MLWFNPIEMMCVAKPKSLKIAAIVKGTIFRDMHHHQNTNNCSLVNAYKQLKTV
jgi:hypothetical protein